METGFLEKMVWKVEPERWCGPHGNCLWGPHHWNLEVERSRDNIRLSKHGEVSGSGTHQHLSCACSVVGAW